jgi:hypothetical protein
LVKAKKSLLHIFVEEIFYWWCSNMRFLSERAISLHKNYVESERLRLSALRKGCPALSEMSAREVLRSRFKDKREVASVMLNIRCHELYFSSFGKHYSSSRIVREVCGSEATFLYDIQRIMMETQEKFLFVCSSQKGIRTICGDEFALLRLDGNILAIDLSGHAYFLDYGFDKLAYIKNLLPYFDLSLLDKKIFLKD